MKLSIKYFLSKCDQSFLQFSEDLVTFTEEILNGKLHNFCAVIGWAPSFSLLEIVAQKDSLKRVKHDQIHHKRNNWLGLICFSPGHSHIKGLLVLFHLGLESVTEVDTDP